MSVFAPPLYLPPQAGEIGASNITRKVSGFMKQSIVLLLVILMPGFVPQTGQAADVASDEFAMSVTIVQAGVEINRSETDSWIILRENAVTPFGVGDRLRTDRTGRALLTFRDMQTLILPLSSIEIGTLADAGDNQANFLAHVTGQSIHTMPDVSHFAAYQLEAAHLVVTQPSARFGIQTDAEVADYAVSASGTLGLMVAEESILVEKHTNVRVRDEADPPVTIPDDVPINFARIEGELDGCPGVIQTANNVLLRVRAGPSDDFFYMGSIPDDTPIQLMGTALGPGGVWYRFQFLADFGWVVGNAIETDCTGLTEYPNFGVENAPGLVMVQDFEIELLAPFFGMPADDVWFYRQ